MSTNGDDQQQPESTSEECLSPPPLSGVSVTQEDTPPMPPRITAASITDAAANRSETSADPSINSPTQASSASYDRRKQELLKQIPQGRQRRPPRSFSTGTPNAPPADGERRKQASHQRQERNSNGRSRSAQSSTDLSVAEEPWTDLTDAFEETIAKPGRKVIHNFFYPARHDHTHHGRGDAVGYAPKRAALRDTTPQQMGAQPPELQTPYSSPQAKPHTSLQATDQYPDQGSAQPNQHSPLQHMSSPQASAPEQQQQQHVSSVTPNMTTPQQTSNNSRKLKRPPRQSQKRRRRRPQQPQQIPIQQPPNDAEPDPELLEQDRKDREYVAKFWTAYDEFLILSLFTQAGILCRLAAAYWFRIFDSVFRVDSALFVNLPLNCLSCFVVGMLGSGENLMEIIATRFTPPRLQQELHQEAQASLRQQESMMDELDYWDALVDTSVNTGTATSNNTGRLRRNQSFPSTARRRRGKRSRARTANVAATGQPHWQPKDPNMQIELREVQLLALERRIRMSPCLLLFPVKKQDVDVVETYSNNVYRANQDVQSNVANGLPVQGKDESYVMEEGSIHSNQSSIETGAYFSRTSSFSNDDLALGEDGFDDLILEEEGAEDEPIEANNGFANISPAEAAIASMAAKEAIQRSREQSIADNNVVPPSAQIQQPRDVPSFVQQTPHSPPDENEEQPASNSAHSQAPGRVYANSVPHTRHRRYARAPGGNVVDYGQTEHQDIDIIITNVAAGMSQKISRISRVSLADGWDVGTSPEEKSEDLMLGLRVGLCGALSSFSSWLSSMVLLLKDGDIGQAFVGLALGIQLPIVSYRFGQHVAVYMFIWRCRRETRRDERRGYGIRLSMDDDSEDGYSSDNSVRAGRDQLGTAKSKRDKRTRGRRTVQEEDGDDETPSVRAIITALSILAFVAQITAVNFFRSAETRLLALSLFFSPLGVITRWRLSKLNSWRPNFPIGTFACNLMACALSGSLGSILAGNPGPRERILLVSVIAGFGGTLSSVARFIVEILEGVDPVLFRLDGIYYAFSSVFWGCVVSFFFRASVDWVESVGQPAVVAAAEAAAEASNQTAV